MWKCNQSRPGFEVMSLYSFPTTITITPRAPPFISSMVHRSASWWYSMGLTCYITNFCVIFLNLEQERCFKSNNNARIQKVLFDLYFGDSNSDGEFERFDPQNIVLLWCWVDWLFVQWHETIWLHMKQGISEYNKIVNMDEKKYVVVIISAHILGVSFSNNLKFFQCFHVSAQKFNQRGIREMTKQNLGPRLVCSEIQITCFSKRHLFS